MSRFSFRLDHDQNVVLHWDEEPAPFREPLKRSDILQGLHEAGYGDYQVDDRALNTFLGAQERQGRESRWVTIAHQVAGKIHVHCSPDGLQAWIEVTPAKGCSPPPLEDLKAALTQEKVSFGIKDEVWQLYGKQGFLPKTLVAEGTPMDPGQPTRFVYLCESETEATSDEQALHQNIQQNVDHKQKNLFVSVDSQTPLMRKVPAVAGKAGTSIFGETLPPPALKDLPLQASPGSEISESDPLLLVASRAGQPIRMRQSVRIDPVLVLPGVNYDTGHIDFKGSVHVKGDVAEGFHVYASGDISVEGTIEDAELVASNHIMVKGSVFGKTRALLKAGGNITATYVQNATVECLGNLRVKNGLFFSHVKVLGTLIAGVERGHGRVHGGEIWAGKDVTVNILGSEAETQTGMYLGEDPYLREQIKALETELKQQQNQLQELLKSMIYLRTRADGDPEEKAARLKSIQEEREELLPRIQLMDYQIQKARENIKTSRYHCRLRVKQKVYAGVSLRLMQVPRFIHEATGQAEFFLRENEKGWEVRANLQ